MSLFLSHWLLSFLPSFLVTFIYHATEILHIYPRVFIHHVVSHQFLELSPRKKEQGENEVINICAAEEGFESLFPRK